MNTINITEKDYQKLQLLIKIHQDVYGTEGVTNWTFEDLNDLQKIGTQIVNILTPHLEINYAETILDTE